MLDLHKTDKGNLKMKVSAQNGRKERRREDGWKCNRTRCINIEVIIEFYLYPSNLGLQCGKKLRISLGL